MTRICHMTSAHGEEDIRIFMKECVSLADAGFDVYLVERGKSYTKNGVKILGVGDISQKRMKRMLKGAKAVFDKALSVDADLYHIHDPELLPYGLILKKKGKIVVFDSHEHYRTQISHKDYLPGGLAKIVSKVYGAYEDYVLQKIDGVIFPCPINGEYPFRCKHKAYVNNYPRLSELYDKYDENAVKEENTVCLVGSLTYNRGIRHFVEAVHKAGCKAIVGGILTPDSFREEILSSKMCDNIVFLGKLNREEVLSVLKRSVIGISVLLNIGQYQSIETLPTKVCEYMSLGLPVILNRTPFNERMLGDYDFGVCVDPENIDEYSSAISFLLNNPKEAERMGMNGRKAIKEEFNWEKEQIIYLSYMRIFLGKGNSQQRNQKYGISYLYKMCDG